MKPVLDMMMSGVSETIDFQLGQIFDSVDASDRYVRIQTTIPSGCSPEMDDASVDNLDALKNLGIEVARKHEKELDRFVDLLLT